MRAVSRAARGASLALALALPAGTVLVGAVSVGPASAQVQQNDPNAANASLARQSDMRAQQQQRVSDFNTLNIQAQRNVQFRPPDPYRGPVGLRRGGGRHGGAAYRGGFNTGVCVGC